MCDSTFQVQKKLLLHKLKCSVLSRFISTSQIATGK